MKSSALITILTFFLISSSVISTPSYIEASSNTHDYSDSSYISPDALPKADIFYTPFNAYRTYCAVMSCPATTEIIQVREVPAKVKEPKPIVTKRFYSSSYAKPIAPIYDYRY